MLVAQCRDAVVIHAIAPARVNIIGEHTDYNDGLVLPTCTALFTRVSGTRRADHEVHVRSMQMADSQTFNLDELQPGDAANWVEYVKGVAAGLQAAGIDLSGADLQIDSDIPLGAGLSSSASLELAVAKALLGLAGDSIADSDLALLCQKAEHDYAGVHCGIMDQYALACAELGKALLLDCRSMQTSQIEFPRDLTFILTDSGVRHSLVDGEYNSRAEECAAAVTFLSKFSPAVESLRDVSEPMLEANKSEMNELLYRRCRHVVSENQRVLDTVQALETEDLQQVGLLLTACHESLCDDFEVSSPELDALVECATSSNLVLGSRMVGAGFGGCVLSACRKDDVQAAAEHIQKSYATVSGKSPWQHQLEPAHPARVLDAE